jgi:DNA-binding FadR family transcriptional regulator
MKIEIAGLDKLQRELEEARRGLESLNGTIATLKYNPADSRGVQAAVRQMEAAIDSKIARYSGNSLVSKAAEAMKGKFRDEILRKKSGL